MNITYSFVIPHHNSPDLLQRLLNSIPQREDIEIIVVDDNSDDDKKASTNRPDVKIIKIDKEHSKGAGRARNVGIDAANGKWLLFADADDFYKSDFIDILDDYKDDDIEILYFNIDSVDSDTLLPGNIDRSLSFNRLCDRFDGSEKRKHDLLFFNMGPWNKMVRTSFVRKYNIRFEEVVVSNDSFFTIQIGYFVKKFKVDKRKLYVLTVKVGSITYSAVTKEKYSTAFVMYRRRAKLFNYMGHPEWNKRSCRGVRSQSCMKYLYKLFKTRPIIVFIKALSYYLTHFLTIERSSNYYVDVIREIENNHGGKKVKFG